MSNVLPTKWTAKEIAITFGFGILLVALSIAGDCLGFAGAVWWIYGVPVFLLFAAIPYYYIAAREPRYGTFTIIGFVFLLYGLLAGSLSNVPYLVCTLIGLVVPDLVRMAMGYKSFVGTLISYLFFAVARLGAVINVWLMPEWCHGQAIEEMGEDYANALVYDYGSALHCVLFLVAALGAAVVGAFLAKAVLRNALTRYGMLGGSASGPKATA